MITASPFATLTATITSITTLRCASVIVSNRRHLSIAALSIVFVSSLFGLMTGCAPIALSTDDERFPLIAVFVVSADTPARRRRVSEPSCIRWSIDFCVLS